MLETREFICDMTNRRGGAQITPDDIIFFNGLGDAIAKIYGCLRPESRVLMPSPTYTTHSIGEAGHAHAAPVCYRLKAEDSWAPDLEDLRNHVRYNPADLRDHDHQPGQSDRHGLPGGNADARSSPSPGTTTCSSLPTKSTTTSSTTARQTVPISDVIGDVPAIAMKGISKEFPWPGSRCGWIEVYNYGSDDRFKKYVNSILECQDERGLLHHAAAEIDPGDHDPSGIPELPRRSGSRATSG